MEDVIQLIGGALSGVLLTLGGLWYKWRKDGKNYQLAVRADVAAAEERVWQRVQAQLDWYEKELDRMAKEIVRLSAQREEDHNDSRTCK